MKKISDINFFKTDTITLAKNLIGKWIVVCYDGKEIKAQISETEAYLGENDIACHSYRGKKTSRTEIMFKDGGTIYVYLCYGLHHLFNIVSRDQNHPEAVLIRACKEANGPAKLTKYLGITKEFNGQCIVGNSKISIMDDGKKYSYSRNVRVGIDYALKKDKKALLRFILK